METFFPTIYRVNSESFYDSKSNAILRATFTYVDFTEASKVNVAVKDFRIYSRKFMSCDVPYN